VILVVTLDAFIGASPHSIYNHYELLTLKVTFFRKFEVKIRSTGFL